MVDGIWWAIMLQEYNFKVTQHAKVVNQNANGLNWNPHANNMVL
jgi:hypothetical protein